jgi:hypothetical protein
LVVAEAVGSMVATFGWSIVRTVAVWWGSPIDFSCTTYSGELIWEGTRPSAFRRAGEP